MVHVHSHCPPRTCEALQSARPFTTVLQDVCFVSGVDVCDRYKTGERVAQAVEVAISMKRETNTKMQKRGVRDRQTCRRCHAKRSIPRNQQFQR